MKTVLFGLGALGIGYGSATYFGNRRFEKFQSEAKCQMGQSVNDSIPIAMAGTGLVLVIVSLIMKSN